MAEDIDNGHGILSFNDQIAEDWTAPFAPSVTFEGQLSMARLYLVSVVALFD